MKRRPDYSEVFLTKFVRGNPDECWEWKGAVHTVGAGGRFFNGNVMVLSHVYAYEFFVGAVPDGEKVYQTCRNRLCVNPSHLVSVSREEALKRNLKLRVVAGMGDKLPSGCIEWQKVRHHETGYGQIKFGGKMLTVSRVVYELFVGPILPGLVVCHKCDNPPCCNPDHLFVGTHLDNAQDRDRKGRINPRHGSFNPKAKLSEPQVLEIKRLYVSGSSSHAIAGSFSVSESTVENIVSGRTWKYLQEEREAS